MKQIKKKPAILLVVLLSIVLLVGTIFAFVPMTFGHTEYKSFAGAINLGNDFGESMYAEYDIKKDGSTETVDIQKSIQTIKSVLSDKGYPSSQVYSINNEKIRVELSYASGEDNFKETYTLLKAVGVGKFELRSSSDEKDTYIVGSQHISGVSLSTYQTYTYVTLEFNSGGQEAFAALLEKATTIYVCMGGATQTSFSAENVTSGTSLPLTFNDYNSAVDFAMRVKLGTIPVDLNSDTVSINTISVNTTILPVLIVLGVAVVAAILYFILCYGVMGWMNLVSTLISAIVMVILFASITVIEFNTSSFLALVFGFALTVLLKNVYMQRVSSEYKTGKTIEASLESGYKKSVPSLVAIGVAALIPTIVLAFISSGIIKTVSLIIVIMTAIGMIESIFIIPWLLQIVESFNKGNNKIYHIKREEV